MKLSKNFLSQISKNKENYFCDVRKDALIKIDEFRNNKQTKSYTHDKNYKSPLINPRLPFVKHDEVKIEKIVQ